MTNRLENKVALITGGTSGIGAETARLFINEGAKVIISGRSQEKGEILSNELGGNSKYILSDVTKEEDIENSIKETLEEFGKLDILFNNAGGPVGAGIEKVTQKDIDYGVHLLLASVILGTKFAIEPMRKNGGGCIINNSSIAGIRYRQGDPLYAALKAGVTHYTRMSGVELGPDNIRVNSISPGAIATPIFWGGSQRANTLSDEENEKKLEKLKGNLAKAVPLNRSGLALDIAEAALYLASDAGSFVSCQDIVVDGGRTAMFNE
ncbi:MAG: SDR family oxidoreductase [Gammaproteobacteria bacterium]|jgi:NAD(P)-dependent dehydrogenase (short-subunit alcohol dehydrogenase family)|nr:MAG: SDR family oxidoreductase [Gammaproteobacteria bacterium]